MSTFDAVFFDLDSTLVDERYIATASVAACNEFATAHPGIDPAALARANYEEWMRYWPEAEQDWILGRLPTDELRHEVSRRTFASVGVEDEALIPELNSIYRRHEQAEYLAFPDALATIDALRGQGTRVAIVTNGASDTQREKLDLLSITKRVDAIIVSAEVGAAKPDPAIFAAALAAVGVASDRAAHVGDSLHADVGGALAAGVHAIWLDRTGAERAEGDPVPDRVISSLEELLEL